MAVRTPKAHSYILVRDSSPYICGVLLKLNEDGHYYPHAHATFPVPCHPSPDALAPLTEEECVLLESINHYADRYTVYSTSGWLAWGLGLNVGDTVLARLPDRNGQQVQYTTAIIRWAGRTVWCAGHKFGVEITVSL